jgi:predicted NBD/HSP70 family sugar kinase
MAGESTSARYFLGIDLGGTNVKAGVVDNGGHSRSSVSRPTEAAKGP